MMGITPMSVAYTETKQITVGVASSAVIAADTTSQLLFTNVGANVVFVRVAPTATAAQLNLDLPLLPNSAIVITRDITHTHVSAIAAATGNTLHVTPVQGN